MSDVKMTDMKLTEQFAGHENAGHKIEGHKSTPIRKMLKIKAKWGSVGLIRRLEHTPVEC